MKKLLNFFKEIEPKNLSRTQRTLNSPTLILLLCFILTTVSAFSKDNGLSMNKNVISDSEILNIEQMNQRVKISGKVTDSNGAPLLGVSIGIKGTSIGTISDIDGNYSIEIPDGNALLFFSYVGFSTKEISVKGQSKVDVSLEENVLGMDEAIVVGYGTIKKSDIISSVTSVKADKMTKVATLDLGEMLRGKAAGVQITTDNSGPGGSSKIQIRGKGSITAGTAPIIIADGVEIGSINDINPWDMSSVEILKDAAAQAIYGARASNGVVLITTKRGKAGQARVNYSGYYGSQTVKRNFDVYSPEEYAQLKREAFRTNNNGKYGDDLKVFSAAEYESIKNGTYIDWEKEVLRLGSIQNHDINVSGGNENTKFYLSGNFQNQKGIVPNTDINKGMIRFNLDQTINKWFKVGLNSSMALSKANDPGVADVLTQVVRASPLGEVYNEDGTLNAYPTGLKENWNPLTDLKEVSDIKKNRNDLINIFVDFSPIKGLNYRINASRRSLSYREEKYSAVNSISGSSNKMGGGKITTRENSSWTIDNILSYEKALGESHFSATLIQSANEINDTELAIDFPKVPNDILGVYGLESAISWKPSIRGFQRRLLSFAGRVQYDYASKYYITLSGRRDGSTVFGEKNKWGFFPAVALGWNIYKEAFLSDFKPLTNLKLRASYGSVGNEAIKPYGSTASADKWEYISNGLKVSGYVPGSLLPNPGLKWETSTTLNAAIDFGFFDNYISGTVELYKTNTTDLLVDRKISSSTGYSKMRDNIGEIENKGIEVQLDGVFVRKKDFTIGAGIIFSSNKNQILRLFGQDKDGNEMDYPADNWFIGQPIDVFYDWVPNGIWQESEAADIATSAQPKNKVGSIKLLDKNDDKILDDKDRIIQSKMPKWLGSFNLNASFKGVDFSMDVTTVQGILRQNPYLSDYKYGGDLRGYFNGIKVDYWTPENPDAIFPRPTPGTTPANMYLLAKQDASYIKFTNITLGYTLPASLMSRLNMNSIRIYCTGQNLLTLTDYYSYNPEQNPDAYPEARTLSFGIQIGF
jgi:TonB-linked SusC/RagA family outer membrane protein